MSRKIRVLVADDHTVVRMGLVTLLENTPGFHVAGEAEDGESAVRQARALKPDVVVMDVRMPLLDGIEATRKITDADKDVKVLVLTTFGDADVIVQANQAGASGVLMKTSPREELIRSIMAVANGEKVISKEALNFLADKTAPEELTERQREILSSVTRGLTNREIGLQLGISPNVVKGHLHAIFVKLGAANRAEAMAIALRRRLLQV